jgi:hypothetical protein
MDHGRRCHGCGAAAERVAGRFEEKRAVDSAGKGDENAAHVLENGLEPDVFPL